MLFLLKILLWVFVALLSIVVIVLFLPVCISVKYEYEKLTVHLKILFLKFKLYPQKQKETEQEQAKEQSENKEEKPSKEQSDKKQTDEKTVTENKTKQKNSVLGKITFEKVVEMIKTATGAIKIVLKAIRITKIEIVYPVYKDDPAVTAISYGQTQAYLGGAIATLRNFLNLSFENINLIPDFNNEYKYRTYFYCNIWGNTFIIVVAAIYAFITLKRNNIL